jgi:Predicted hydrolases of the HAD superfamily
VGIPNPVEIGLKGKDKAQMLEKLMKSLSDADGNPLSAADCMSFGDGLNDVGMLKVRQLLQNTGTRQHALT